MAKKKVTPEANNHKQQQQPIPIEDHRHTHSHHQPKTNDDIDSSDKLQNLKSLNSLLLKEAFEKRQQVESLEHDKETLESDLARAGMENKVLEAELLKECEENVGLGLEKDLCFVFVETQMREMGGLFLRLVGEKGEIERERDSLRKSYDGMVSEVNGLQETVVKIWERKRELEGEVGSLRKGNEELISEIYEKGRALEGVTSERDLVYRKMAESEKVIKELRKKIEGISMQKNEMEKEKNALEHKIIELEKEMEQLNGVLLNLKREEDLMRERESEMEERERKLEEENEKLRKETEKLFGENDEKGRTIVAVTRERDLANSKIVESERIVEELRTKIEGILVEKNEIERENSARELKIIVLQRDMEQLNEIVSNLREEEDRICKSNCELENRIDQAMEKEKEMEMEIRALMEDEKEKEKIIERFKEENGCIKKVLSMLEEELVNKQSRIEETIKEKNAIEELNVGLESKVSNLHKEMDELKDTICKLERSHRDQEEKSKQLLSGFNNYKSAFEELTHSQHEVQKNFDEEKKKVKDLVWKVTEMEDIIKHSSEELRLVRSDNEKLIEKNKELENGAKALMNEKNVLQKNLLEVQQDSNTLQAKVELAQVNSNQTLTILKNTVELLSHSKEVNSREESLINGEQIEQEIKPFAEELDAIRNAFKSKNDVIENMKQELDSLHNSAAQANKTKNIWKLISSACTAIVAASLAYAAKGR